MTIEKTFNKVADEGAFAPVVDYVNADPTLKTEMEMVMGPIDRNPDSFDAVISYGHPVFERLGERHTPDKIHVYLGTFKEVLRRYNEKYIPEANKNFEKTNDKGAEKYMRDVHEAQRGFHRPHHGPRRLPSCGHDRRAAA